MTAIADSAPVLIWTAIEPERNDWHNRAWVEFTGRSTDDLGGSGWQESVHPEDVGRCLGIRAASFEARQPYSMDIRLRRHDGHYRWMLDQAAPRDGVDGKGVFVGSVVDIHDRKMLEETLAERTQALRLAERRQGRFLATLSHELRNPLAPIGNAAGVLRTLEHTNPILVRLREILERQVSRLGRLVDELVDATRVAQGQVSLVRELVSVDSIVQAAVARAHERITAGGHRLQIDMPDEELTVRGDPGRLAQALANLIGNAAKFSTGPDAVEIAVRRVARTVQIVVRDHGQGIDAAFLPHVFELFAQQDQTRARSMGGLGVGLTLARRVVQLHGGDIEALSDGPGLGSEFILWLPLADRAADARPVPDRSMGESTRVLIVEDNADARESLRLQMELWGNEVRVARHAEEALEIAGSMQPQIVLCDIGLPGMDGFRFARTLRERLAGRPVVLAAVTGYASDEDQERALAAGFDSFLVKPLEPESLVRLVRAAGTPAPVEGLPARTG